MSEEICAMCERCKGACCKHLVVPTRHADRDFWEARGLIVTDDYKGQLYGVFPHRCPHLTDEGLCDMYDTRSQTCRQFRPGSKYCLLSQKIEKLRKECGEPQSGNVVCCGCSQKKVK